MAAVEKEGFFLYRRATITTAVTGQKGTVLDR